jgi:hypothetical protein
MQSALKLSALLLCLSLTSGTDPSPAPGGAERAVIAGCPATAIVCPDPKPAADEKPVPKKGQKSAKG